MNPPSERPSPRPVLPAVLAASALAAFVLAFGHPAPAGPTPPASPLKYYDPLP